MSAKLPMKYFTGCIASISYKKVDKWAENYAKNGIYPYFDTWEEAHDYMLDQAKKDLARKEKDFASAKRHLIRVEAMTNKYADKQID